MSRSDIKLFIFGLDGATFDIIDPLIETGKLPTIERILKLGTRGELRSTIHPITPVAWSSFITGTNAGKHGIFDFRVKIKGTYTFALTNGGSRTGKSIWRILSENDHKVGVLNVPFTYPAEPVNGYMLPGFDAPKLDGSFSFPDGIYERIVENVGRYDLKGTFPVGIDIEDYDIGIVDEVIKNRYEVAKYLIETENSDFFMMVFNEIDHMQHLFWKQMEDFNDGDRSEDAVKFGQLIERAYIKVDEALGKLLKLLPDEAYVMLMSDHGSTRIKRVINLNGVLEKHNLLNYHKKGESGRNRILLGATKSVRALFKRLLNESQIDNLKDRFKKFADQAESYVQYGEIDWGSTRAYSHGIFGNISINLQGREPKGIVSQDDYQDLCQSIKEILLTLEDPDTKEKIVDRVHMKSEIYSGDNLDRAPDLLVEFKNYSYYSPSPSEVNRGEIFITESTIDSTNINRSGTHDLRGIFSLMGPCIRPAHLVENAEIIDVAPTILNLFDISIPSNMDGKVLSSIFTDEFKNQVKISYDESPDIESSQGQESNYSSDEEEEVRKRLSGLGYIE